MIYKVDDFYRDFDHYSPYKKQLARDYCIPSAIKGVITETVPPPNKLNPVEQFLLDRYSYCPPKSEIENGAFAPASLIELKKRNYPN
jgi:hypothetical protein